MPASLIPIALQQYIDADGNPYANGTISFYVPNSMSPKQTYQDANETVLNTTPSISLDAAGRPPPIFGDGDFRCILKDQDGVTIFDALASAPLEASVINAVLLPSLGASSLSQFRDLAGITLAIANAIAAISLLPGPQGDVGGVGPAGPQGIQGIQGIQGPPGPAATAGGNGIVQAGSGTTDASGYLTISFPTTFPNLPVQITVSISAVSVSTLVIGGPIVSYLGSMALVSFTTSSVVVRMFDAVPVPVAGQLAIWMASGY